MTKKTLAILVASFLILSATNMTGVSAKSSEDLPIGYYNIAEPYRYLTFATDGGSFIKALEKPIGEKVNLDTYIPTKSGYIFDGWYSDPRTKQVKVTEVTLTENIVVYAKWLDDGSVKPQKEQPIGLTREQALAYGNYQDAKTGVPVTRLWVQQNARLQELMQEYNAKFNK